MARNTKNRKARRRVGKVAIGDVKECIICSKDIGAGRPQERTVVWKGSKSHACNACGISWKDLLGKKRKLEGRDPTADEWDEWKNGRPDFIDPQARDAANTLLTIAYSRRSRTSSPSCSFSSSSSSTKSTAPSSLYPSSDTYTTVVGPAVEIEYSSQHDISFSSYAIVPPAVYKTNRPAGLTVDVEGALFVTCNDTPDFDFSPASGSEFEPLPITPSFSWYPNDVLRASSGGSIGGSSAYLDEGKPSAALLPKW